LDHRPSLDITPSLEPIIHLERAECTITFLIIS